MNWTIEGLDDVIARAKANRRSTAYVSALERRRAALVAKALPAAAVEVDAEVRAVLDTWLEASAELMGCASAVGQEDALDIGRMMGYLASWFRLIPDSEDGEDVGDAM